MRKITTSKTVTVDRARQGVKVYNEGLYGSVKNPDFDKRAHGMFADGLGSTLGEIERQVTFIGDDYGRRDWSPGRTDPWHPISPMMFSRIASSSSEPPELLLRYGGIPGTH